MTGASGARRRLALAVLAVVAAGLATGLTVWLAGRTPAGNAADGRVRLVRTADASFDGYAESREPRIRRWITHDMWRMVVFSPFWDDKTSWYPRGWLYRDAYAVYKHDAIERRHPNWILHDADGRRLYIPYACAHGTCPQYAGDIGNAAYRAAWIAGVKADLAKGYAGVFVDDVNMSFSVADGRGDHVAPIDRRTGTTMTWKAWRGYMATLVSELRAAIPGKEIVHNSVWYAGDGRTADPFVRRQIAAADYLNVERGIGDAGITGGDGAYSLTALLAYIDQLHGWGHGVVLDATPRSPRAREYELAGYFLISTGHDALSVGDQTPDDWWRVGYKVRLGAAKGGRYEWRGVLRRDFDRGTVLLNEPDAPPRTLRLGRSMRDLSGRSLSTIVLGAKSAAVLLDD